jgi:tRNA(Arg) A34 adenosine deaminase TadA
MNHPNKEFMQQAIALAKESFELHGHAVAAVIVKDGNVIAQGVTTVITDKDSTAHAEINAIRQASEKLDDRYLQDCYLYTTFEPCPMCASAAIWAKMKGIIYGAGMNDASAQEHQRIKIASSDILSKGDPQLELHQEFMHEECVALLHLA